MISLPAGTSDGVIPRCLYQTYPTDDLPPTLARNVEDMRHANPDWQYKLYDDAACTKFILQQYGRDALQTYDMISPRYGAARADLFRYLLLYERGGIYLDVKSRFVAPISSVVDRRESYILSQWHRVPGGARDAWGMHDELAAVPGGEFQQWHVIAAPRHPFLRAVIERVLHNIEHYNVKREEAGWLGVLRLTGPIAYTLAIAPLIGRYPCRVVADERALGLEYSVLDGSEHKVLFKGHYTQAIRPVVRRPGLRGLADRAYMEVRARKRRWFTRTDRL